MVWQNNKQTKNHDMAKARIVNNSAPPPNDDARRRSKSKIDSLNPTPNVLSRNAKIKSEVDHGEDYGDAGDAN